MYLKALEMQGFKSFPEKTRLTFEKDITAIVGPNGSGKSNISDAILWVMGEQRTKTLRGGKMEDVIFGGTEKRTKMGFAQVSLILDNTERFFDTDRTELMITRRYYRSGESEYYINKESVRLKDITELLMDTGLGRYGYSIIGQGKISEIVSARSGDRRELFEEAAGISRYRYRKDESERKLKHTDENLLRINDKIYELKIQVDPLKEQAETAKKYLVLRDELRLDEVSVWMEMLDKLKERALTVQADWEKMQTDLTTARRELTELYAASENYSEKMREKDIDAEKSRAILAETDAAAAEFESEIAVLENTESHNSERCGRLITEMGEQDTRVKALAAQIESHQNRIAEIETELADLDVQFKEITDKLSQNTAQEGENKRAMAGLYSQRSDRQTELSRAKTVLSMLGDAAEEQGEVEKRRDNSISEANGRKGDFLSALREQKITLNESEEKVSGLTNIISGYKMRIEGRSTKVKTLAEKQTKLTIELNSIKSRCNMLAEMEKEFEGYSKSVKTVMRDSERGTLKGVNGPVANLIKTDNRYALAIETALGGSMQSIVVDTQEQAKIAIEMLKRSDSGRATFLPVNTIKPSELRRSPKGEEGYLGTAFELADFDKKFENIFSSLLARTVVAESLTDAIRMSKKFDNQLRIVTLDGQLVNTGGSMTGGSAAKNAGILSRANELKTLLQKKSELEKTATDAAAALSEAERELASARYELQTAEFEMSEAAEQVHQLRAECTKTQMLADEAHRTVTELENEKQNAELRKSESETRSKQAQTDISRLDSELEEIASKLKSLSDTGDDHEKESRELSEKISAFAEKRSSLITESDTTNNAISQLRQLCDDLLGDGETRRATVESLEKEQAELQTKMIDVAEKLNDLKTKSAGIKGELTDINNQKLGLEGKRTQSEKAAQEKNRELLDMERTSAAIEQRKLASEMEEKQIIDKLWDTYELSRTAAQNVRVPIENMSASTKQISSLKRQISALGNPNLGAIEEYDRVSVRYNFLTEQRDDVEQAKSKLEKIIADITVEMKDIFRREFDEIDKSFRKTFLELFGGGRAALILEDEEDILGCGIEIKIQPPGKALTTLSLLSGGETAFVAIALYFAILKVRPSPFCVMDEIEAALDESNVDRYARYMRTMTGETQFVVITHRRGTMEEADMLYGVTMQEKGVSQVLSVDLAEAEKTISK